MELCRDPVHTIKEKKKKKRPVFNSVTNQNTHHRILKLPTVHHHLESYHPKLVSVFWLDPTSHASPASHRLPLCLLDCRACLWQNPLSSQCSFSFSLSLVKCCCVPLLLTDTTEPVGGVFSFTLISTFQFYPFFLPPNLCCFGRLVN